MCETSDNSSRGQGGDSEILPKVEILDCDLSNEGLRPIHIGDDVGSSSGSNVRSSLIGMGFKPFLVDQAIEENGDNNIEVLLEALFSYSADQKPNSEASSDLLFCYNRDAPATQAIESLHGANSSDSSDNLFGDDNDTGGTSACGRDARIKEELDEGASVGEEKRVSLLRMSFSSHEIEFAMKKLGVDAPIDELVDFIFAARIAENCEGDADAHMDNETSKECNPESLFGIMDKILRLLEMGFSEDEISTAIDKHGSEVSVEVLADSIVAGPCSSPEKAVKYPSTVKIEERQSEILRLIEKMKGKRPKEEEGIDEPSIWKRPKQEDDDCLDNLSGPTWIEERNGNHMPVLSHRMPVSFGRVDRRSQNLGNDRTPKLSMPSSCKSLDSSVVEPPYFLYGNVTNLSHDSWVKISQFLYEIEPEFVNTMGFSALDRIEGYVHNLPSQDRCHIQTMGPMTIEEAIPQATKWWPSWDTRKQIRCISSDTSRTSQICDRLGRMLTATSGVLSSQQQRDFLKQCETLNLVWAGKHRLVPLEPEHLERILGYPRHHTRLVSLGLTERLQVLESCFQVNTLAYHLSVLKPLYPGGMTVLSIYSGIGGTEIALDRLGIYLKGVVSIESSETKRRILKQWWEKSEQKGELAQLENTQALSSTKLDGLIKRFGGFDLVICQNPPANSKGVGFDFASFYEFVRVLQHVRSSKQSNR